MEKIIEAYDQYLESLEAVSKCLGKIEATKSPLIPPDVATAVVTVEWCHFDNMLIDSGEDNWQLKRRQVTKLQKTGYLGNQQLLAMCKSLQIDGIKPSLRYFLSGLSGWFGWLVGLVYLGYLNYLVYLGYRVCLAGWLVGMSDSELGGLFVEAEDEKRIVHPAEKVINYTRPSGDTLQVCVVGHHVLWANYLWNGAHWLSDYICTHPDEFRGKTILELGAGAGLPSILAAEAGAHKVVVTDYPDNELIVNIQKNIDSLLDEEAQKRITAKGYLWGADSTLVLSQNNSTQFDMIIMCDVIFNHSEHYKLLRSIKDCLSPEGTCGMSCKWKRFSSRHINMMNWLWPTREEMQT
ncbi:hypothetical protein PSACC_00461 [Paramicrosporidium saccamoebae]|uniref:Nicotinamide N-methyltransferase n=1 Tax=Paramicrosporidium saccamoebae TaxID=1246581 RepID=A0A2H9TPN2_9FUNG|nr:hypothetical protein PSACC_00461 [Paramicrosporidium saccamoebae]